MIGPVSDMVEYLINYLIIFLFYLFFQIIPMITLARQSTRLFSTAFKMITVQEENGIRNIQLNNPKAR